MWVHQVKRRRNNGGGFLPTLYSVVPRSQATASIAASGSTPSPLALLNSNIESRCTAVAPFAPAVELLALRPGAPVISAPTRGKRSAASSELDDLSRERARSSYERDTKASSAWAPSCSLVKTWEHFHDKWFSVGHSSGSSCTTPTLPLTIEAIIGVVSQMKSLGYRSVPNYLSAIKDRHIAAGFPWTSLLDREGRRAQRTALRGIGPAKQCGDFDLNEVFKLGLGMEPLVNGGPLNPGCMAELNCFHLLRDMESSCALASHLSIDLTRQVESLELPVSKTDPGAIGCTRSWGCVCNGKHDSPCAFHAAVEHQALLVQLFGNQEGALPAGLPLFPTAAGTVASPTSVVGTIVAIAERLNLATTDKFGRPVFGKHVYRISGARLLAGMGIPTPVIMLLARWASQVVLRYIADSPLATLTSQFRERSGKASGADIKPAITARIVAQEAKVLELHNSHLLHDSRLGQLTAQMEQLLKHKAPAYVCNVRTNKWHCAGPVEATSDPCLWSTPCGWHYARSVFKRASELPTEANSSTCCDRCLPWVCHEKGLNAADASESE